MGYPTDVDTESSALVYPQPPSGAPYPAEARDFAFTTYLRLDANMEATIRTLALSRDTVYKWRRQDDWDGRITRAEADLTASADRRVRRKLRESADDYVDGLIDIAKHACDKDGHPLHNVRRLAFRDLLDRAGYAPVQRLLIDQRVAQVSVTANLDPDTPAPTTAEATAILVKLMSEDTRER